MIGQVYNCRRICAANYIPYIYVNKATRPKPNQTKPKKYSRIQCIFPLSRLRTGVCRRIPEGACVLLNHKMRVRSSVHFKITTGLHYFRDIQTSLESLFDAICFFLINVGSFLFDDIGIKLLPDILL